MTERYLEIGEKLRDQNPAHLSIPAARRTAQAVLDHPDFELLELRSWTSALGKSEVLIINCATDGVWSRNRVGIRYRERLALRFLHNPKYLPEVRALRSDFPVTLHQNNALPGEPASLCLYFGPWSAIERTWTPQSHLRRIQWWLAETANESLHRSDQPPEQLYFESGLTLVLPPDFDTRQADTSSVMEVELRTLEPNHKRVAVASFTPLTSRSTSPHLSCLIVNTTTMRHGPVERTPATLGELHEQFERRDAPFANALFAELRRVGEGTGLPSADHQFTLLILRVPLVKKLGDEPEFHTKGFLLNTGLGRLGELAQVLHKTNNRYFTVTLLDGQGPAAAWRAIAVEPLEVVAAFTPALARRYNGIARPGPTGVLAGFGALGSAIANIWTRQGWGRWTYIDPDLLMPHNLARHSGYQHQIGHRKVDVARAIERAVYSAEEPSRGIQASANDFTDAHVLAALTSAELIVDASTTLEVSRDLALNDRAPRSVSAFLTPSGTDSVLLLENADQTIRLDALEAQYYRLILVAPWGDKHLAAYKGDLWVGAGCRDVSSIIATENVQIHAALLAGQIRTRSERPEAAIQVWRFNETTGAVDTTEIAPSLPLLQQVPDLRVVWDHGLHTKVHAFRREGLPRETGGVLLGYFDMKNERVYVVDALPAPPDSRRGEAEFVRGIEGLEAAVDAAKRRTGNIVTYIGEWHSHPFGVAALPSHWDIGLLVHLALLLHQDGLPALMLIVGDDNDQWLVGDVRK